MAMSDSWLNRLAPYKLAVLRVVTSLLFLQHGLVKLVGFPAAQPKGFQILSLYGLAALIEVIGSVLVIAGFRTRLVAFILSGEMAVAYFMVHAPKSFYPIVNGGEGAILFCFVFLYIAVVGGGACTLDRR